MEKRDKTLHRKFPPVVLYLDDVEKLAAIIEEVGGSPKIETENYVLTNISEITEIAEPSLTNIKIILPEPRVELYLRTWSAGVRFREDNLTNRGVLAKLEEVIMPRRRKFARLLYDKWSGIGIGFGLLVFFKGYAALGAAFFLLGALWTYVDFKVSRERYALVCIASVIRCRFSAGKRTTSFLPPFPCFAGAL